MRVLLLIIVLFLSHIGWTQTTNRNFNNIIFLELLGNGGYGSLNYERILISKLPFQLGISAGISTFKTKDFNQSFNPDLIIPCSIRAYYGRFRHKALFGIGQTISSVSKLSTADFEPKRSYQISANFMIGYRYDSKRVILQLAYTPIIENYSSYNNWLGVAIGYKF